MCPSSRKRPVSFYRAERGTFQLDTADVSEASSILGRVFARRRASAPTLLARYIAVTTLKARCGTADELLISRSWHRLITALVVLVALWVLGMMV